MKEITWTQNRVCYELPFLCPAHLLSGRLAPCLSSPWMETLELEQLKEEAVEELTAPHRAAFPSQLCASGAVQS